MYIELYLVYEKGVFASSSQIEFVLGSVLMDIFNEVTYIKKKIRNNCLVG